MKKMMPRFWLAVLAITIVTATAQADEVTDWNQMIFRMGLATGTAAVPTSRAAAIVESAVFDAVNGINPRFTSIHVAPAAPKGASPRAAAVQAAYVTLVNLFPTQRTVLDARYLISIGVLSNSGGPEDKTSIT